MLANKNFVPLLQVVALLDIKIKLLQECHFFYFIASWFLNTFMAVRHSSDTPYSKMTAILVCRYLLAN